MQKVNGPRPNALRMRAGKLEGTAADSLRIQRHIQQRSFGQQMFQPRKRRITFANDLGAFA
jgi:hypothetical protein